MRSSGKRSESAFWVGVLTMFGSQLAVKLLGLIYRLVITNIDGFGDVGNGYYSAGFQIYTLLLALSSVGIPSAISKLVAQAEAAGNHRRSEDIFHTAMALFFGIGLVCAAALCLGADFIARSVIGMDGVQGKKKGRTAYCLPQIIQTLPYYLEQNHSPPVCPRLRGVHHRVGGQRHRHGNNLPWDSRRVYRRYARTGRYSQRPGAVPGGGASDGGALQGGLHLEPAPGAEHRVYDNAGTHGVGSAGLWAEKGGNGQD